MLKKIDQCIDESIPLWLNNIIPRWSKLKRVGKSKIVLTSYIWIILVPIAAKFIPYFELLINESCLTIQSYGIECNPEHDFHLPFSWSHFYYGSIAFAISGLLYSIYCPFINIKFENPQEAKAIGYTNYQLKEYLKSKTEFYSNKDFIMEEFEKLPQNVFEDRFMYVYKLFSSKSFIMRFLCDAGYKIGFGYYLWILYKNFCFVIQQS